MNDGHRGGRYDAGPGQRAGQGGKWDKAAEGQPGSSGALKRASPPERMGGKREGRGAYCARPQAEGNRVERDEEGKGSKWRKCTSPHKSGLDPYTRAYTLDRHGGASSCEAETRGPTRRGDLSMREHEIGNRRWVEQKDPMQTKRGQINRVSRVKGILCPGVEWARRGRMSNVDWSSSHLSCSDLFWRLKASHGNLNIFFMVVLGTGRKVHHAGRGTREGKKGKWG